MATGGTEGTPLKDLLDCSICLHPMTDPRCLPCQHSFCLACLESLENRLNTRQRIICPSCRAMVLHKVRNLPADFKLLAVSQFVNREPKEEAVTCSFCSEEAPKREVKVFCMGCDDYLCVPCSDEHTDTVLFASHKLVLMTSRGSVAKRCPQHTRKRMNYYCTDCDISVCGSCVTMKHKKHNIQDVLTYVETCKQKVQLQSVSLKVYYALKMISMNCEIDLQAVTGCFNSRICSFEERIKASAVEKIVSVVYEYNTLLESLRTDSVAFHESIDILAQAISIKSEIKQVLADCANYMESECPSKAEHDKLFSDISDSRTRADGLSPPSSVHIPVSFKPSQTELSVGSISRVENSLTNTCRQLVEPAACLPVQPASCLKANKATQELVDQLLNEANVSNTIPESDTE